MEIHRVDAGRGAGWYADGWNIVKGQIGMWILLILIYFVLAFVLGVIPIIGGLIMALIGPGLIGGLYAAAQASSAGGNIEVGHLFMAFKDEQRRGPMLTLGAINIGLTIVLVLTIGLIIGGGMGASEWAGDDPAMMAQAMQGAGLAGLLAILAVSLAIAMAMIYAVPLVMFTDTPPIEALKLSLKASLTNWLPLLVFGLIFIPLAIIAMIPLMLGWLFLMPVLMGALYASYREIFGAPEAPGTTASPITQMPM